MRLEEALSSYLQPKLNNQLYPFLLPQKCSFPAVAYFPVSVERIHCLSKDTRFVKQRVQFTSFGKTYYTALDTANCIQKELQDFSGEMNGLAIGSVLLMEESTNYESDTGLYAVTLEFEFQFEEE